MASFGARGASRHIVAPNFPNLAHMSQNVECWRAPWAPEILCLFWFRRPWREILRYILASNKPVELVFLDPPQAFEVRHLCFQCVVRPIEPKSPVGPAMNAQRTANGVAKLAFVQRVVFRKYLNA